MAYVVNNSSPPWDREKQLVFHAILAVARLVIWNTRLRECKNGDSFSSEDLIRFFNYQLKTKIRCDRKKLAREAFCERWIKIPSLVIRKNDNYFITFVKPMTKV